MKYGGSGIIKCIVAGKPKPTVKWFLNDNEIKNSRQFVISGYNLYVINATETIASSVITCLASNNLNQEAKDTMLIDMKFKVNAQNAILHVTPNTIKSKTGNTAHFDCGIENVKDKYLIENLNDLRFRWYKDDSAYINTDEDGQMILRELNENDAGVYSCQLKNIRTNEMSKKVYTKLIVNPIAPEVNVEPLEAKKSFNLGESVSYECKVIAGNPKPEIEWRRKDGKSLPDRASISRADNEVTLTLANVNKEDEGVYECHAKNDEGETSDELNLVINEKIAQPIMVSINDGGYGHKNGNDIKLKCEISNANGAVYSYKWSYNKSPIEEIGFRNFIISNENLTIVAAKPEQSGIYNCDVETNEGLVGHSSIVISVDENDDEDYSVDSSEVFDERKPRISPALPKEVRAHLRGLVRIECSTMKGSPEADIVWQRADDLPISERAIVNSSRMLEIKDFSVKDYGVYKCIARNSAGEDSIHIEIKPFD